MDGGRSSPLHGGFGGRGKLNFKPGFQLSALFAHSLLLSLAAAVNPSVETIRSALDEYYRLIPLQGGDAPPDMRPVIAELDRLGREAGPGVPPRLRHYLESKSYAKALAFLADPPKGAPLL